MAIVDIVVPCYRYARFLPSCVSSILTQSLGDLRIMIVDDASPDDTAVVARRLAAQDRRIEVVSHRVNHGHIETYNEGIEWATSDYFLVFSADDLLAPGALERAVGVMQRHPEVVLTHGASIPLHSDDPSPRLPVTSPDDRWEIRPGLDLIREMCGSGTLSIATTTAIVRTTVQKRVGGYRPELPHAGDLEMFLRLASHGAVAATPAVQAFRRVHGKNMSSLVYQTGTGDYWQCKAAFDAFFSGDGASLPNSGQLRHRADRRLAERAFWSAMAHCWRGDREVAWELLRYTWRLSPMTLLLPPVGHLLRTKDLHRKLQLVLSERRARA